MYCLLAAHVKFTSSDQSTHMTTLMNMKDLFSAGKMTTLKNIEQARAMLKSAKDVGVVPTYDLVGMAAIQSLAEIDAVRDSLRTERLPPEKAPRFKPGFRPTKSGPRAKPGFKPAQSWLGQTWV